jgi:hypothetical protein
VIVKCDYCNRQALQSRAGKFQDKEYGAGNRIQNQKESDRKIVVCTVCGKENKI